MSTCDIYHEGVMEHMSEEDCFNRRPLQSVNLHECLCFTSVLIREECDFLRIMAHTAKSRSRGSAGVTVKVECKNNRSREGKKEGGW